MRILVIEDEIKLANAIKRALEIQKYAVDTAYDGESGLDLAIGEQYDLIILDLMLPKIDGLTICSKVRKEKIHTPFLMLTAKGQIGDKVTGLDTGADDYMIKPFSFEELFARIRALVRRTVNSSNVLLTVGNIVLDPIKLKVTRDGKLIDISAKEFAILEYLLRHKNSVATKEQIVNHVWNYDADVLPSTVEVHIKHIRDKVDSSPHKSLIKTIRGFGYEIREDK